MANQVTIIKPPLYGSVIWDGSNFIYTPQDGFVGQDFYIYTITDGITSQTLTNYTNTVNVPPSAGNINLTINAEDVLNINLDNYVIDDGLIKSYRISNITTPSIGIVGYSNNIITYKSNGFDGVDRFFYTITDGQYNSTGTINLNIINGNNIQVPQYIQDQFNILQSIVVDVQSLSSDWYNTYSILCGSSGNWNNLDPSRYNSVYNVVTASSADWSAILSSKSAYDQTYSVVTSSSADWNYVKNNIGSTNTILSTNSADWLTSYTLLCVNSADWNTTTVNLTSIKTTFSNKSGDWNAAYTLVQGGSSGWDKTYYLNILSTGSANWDNSYSVLTAGSGSWNNNTTKINSLTSLFNENSGNWRKAYNTVFTLSTGWGDLTALTLLTATSSDWNKVANAKPLYDSAVTILSTTSGDWNYVKDNFGTFVNTFSSGSGNWETTYSILCASSSNWNNAYTAFTGISTDYVSNSGKWTNTYNLVCAGSADWDTTVITNILTSNSGYWDSSYNNLTANSGKWTNSYNTFTAISTNYIANSAYWDTTYSIVCTGSSSWSDTTVYNLVTAKSGDWNTIYNKKSVYDSAVTILSTTSGNWNYVRDNFSPISNLISSKSADWTNTYSVVCSNSSSWNTITDKVSTLTTDYSGNSGNWNATYVLVSTNSGSWDNKDTIQLVNDNYTNWTASYNALCASSGTWNLNNTNLTNLTTAYNLSAPLWNAYYNIVSAGSSVWGDAAAVSIITAQSAYYETAYNIVCAGSTTWNNVSSVYSKYDNTVTIVSANSSNWINTVNIVSAGSASWYNTTSLITGNSGKWLNGAVDLNFTTNNLIVSGNAIFYGSLTADGATTQLNTTVVATSAFALNNTGNVDALAVTKTTTSGALANFSNAGGSVLYVSPNNKVGINTSSPSEALTVVGNITASGYVYGQTPLVYTTFQTNSGRYETTSSYFNLSSVTLNQLLTTSKPSYDTAYTYVTGVSTTISNFISVNKPSYDTAYNTVTSQSGTVYTSYTFLTAQSGKIGTDTIYRSKSANYESAYTWVQNNSGATAAVSQINVIFDGGGDIINSGSYVIIQIPAKIGIVNWTLYSDIATTNSYIDVLSCDYANYPTFVRISPASNTDANYVKIISGTQKAPNIIPTTLTGWTTGVAADSLLKFNLIANSTATLLTLSLKCIKLT